MDIAESLSEAVRLPIGETTMKISIHDDNGGALVFSETIPSQFTTRSKHYGTKHILFCEEIVRRSIKLLKDNTVKKLGDLFAKGLTCTNFEYLQNNLMGW